MTLEPQELRVEIHIVWQWWGTDEDARTRLVLEIQTGSSNFGWSVENDDVRYVILKENAESSTSRSSYGVSFFISSKGWRGDCNWYFTSASRILLQHFALQCRYRYCVQIEHVNQVGTPLSMERSKIRALASKTRGTSGIWRDHRDLWSSSWSSQTRDDAVVRAARG